VFGEACENEHETKEQETSQPFRQTSYLLRLSTAIAIHYDRAQGKPRMRCIHVRGVKLFPLTADVAYQNLRRQATATSLNYLEMHTSQGRSVRPLAHPVEPVSNFL